MDLPQLAPGPVEIVDNSALLAMSDDELWRRTKILASQEREATVELVEYLAELDSRRLWFKNEFNGLFEYCVCCLRLSEDAAYKRIRAARAIRLFPPIVLFIRSGLLSLAAVVRLHPFLDRPDAASFVKMAAGLRIRNLERMLAAHQSPERRKRDVVHFIAPIPPESPPAPEASAPLLEFPVRPVAAAGIGADSKPPLPSPERPSARISFTAGADFIQSLDRARQLLRHKYPDGRLEGVLGDALASLLAKRDPMIRWAKDSKRGRRPTGPGASRIGG